MILVEEMQSGTAIASLKKKRKEKEFKILRVEISRMYPNYEKRIFTFHHHDSPS